MSGGNADKNKVGLATSFYRQRTWLERIALCVAYSLCAIVHTHNHKYDAVEKQLFFHPIILLLYPILYTYNCDNFT